MPVRNTGLFVLLSFTVALVACTSSALAPVEQRSALHSNTSVPTRSPALSGASPSSNQGKPNYHIVRRGDTLYSIAWRYGLDYRNVASWNRIEPPYTIFPGQRVDINGTFTASSPQSPNSNNVAKRRTRTETSKESATSDSEVGWKWPTRGKMIASFQASGRKGVDIAGHFDQPIYAAAGGRVVYSGGGLRGYGKLIIIKHNKRFLSAYAHNNKLLVEEGDKVSGGQHIASMGRSGADRVMLHFEIRHDGNPVDPARYLPKKAT